MGIRSSVKSGRMNSRKSLGLTTSVMKVPIASPHTICWRPIRTSKSPRENASTASRRLTSVCWSLLTLVGIAVGHVEDGVVPGARGHAETERPR